MQVKNEQVLFPWFKVSVKHIPLWWKSLDLLTFFTLFIFILPLCFCSWRMQGRAALDTSCPAAFQSARSISSAHWTWTPRLACPHTLLDPQVATHLGRWTPIHIWQRTEIYFYFDFWLSKVVRFTFMITDLRDSFLRFVIYCQILKADFLSISTKAIRLVMDNVQRAGLYYPKV